MSSGGRRVLLTLLLLGLVALVFAPLRGAMPIGEDPRILAAVADLRDSLRAPALGGSAPRAPEDPSEGSLTGLFALGADGLGPLASASLLASDRLWRRSGTWEGPALTALRLENLALLLGAALGLSLFVRRLLEPWSSLEHAQAAGLAALWILALHPLAPSAVHAPGARGDLLALALVLPACALFLGGRQGRHPRRVLAAGVLVLLAGLASELALLAAPLLAFAEGVSARRSRPPAVRRRTALTTLAVFGTLAASGPLLGGLLGLEGGPPRLRAALAMFDDLSDLLAGAGLMLERFGLVLFPINARGTGLFDFVALGMLLMLALHPALSAARAAPRFWGTVLAAWFAGMLLVQLPVAGLRVHPSDWTHARQLLFGAAGMAGGLAIASTAVSGRRRVLIPTLVVLGLGLLARADADCLNRAGRPARRLQQDLVAAVERFEGARHLLVVEPPGLVRAHRSVDPSLAALLHPSLVGASAPRPEVRLRGLDAEALRWLLRSSEGRELCAEGLVVHLSPDALGVEHAAGEPFAILARAPRASSGPRTWHGAGASPALDLDPLDVGCLIAVPSPERPIVLPPLVRWHGAGDTRLPAGLEGTWIAGREGTYAVFDLDRSLPWLLSGRVERVWLEGGVAEPEEARLETTLPELAVARVPEQRGEDWAFALEAEAPLPLGRDQDFVLAFLELEGLRRFEVPAYLTPRGELLAEEVGPLLRRLRRAGGPVLWSLEHRAAGRAVARAGGRL